MTTYEEWLAAKDEDSLTRLLARRPDVALDPPPRTYPALAHLLTSPASVAAALRSLDRGALTVLKELQSSKSRELLGTHLDEGGVNSTADIDRALEVVVEHGLAWPVGHEYCTVALPERGFAIGVEPRTDDRWVGEYRVEPCRSGGPGVQQLAVARIGEVVDAIAQQVDSRSIAVRKAGGVGVRELRALTAAVDAKHPLVVELVLELAARAGLIDASHGAVRAGARMSTWAASGRAGKLSTLIAAWWCADGSPTNRPAVNAKAVPVLGASRNSPATAVLRRTALAEVPNCGFLDDDGATGYLEWRLPELVNAVEPGDIAAIWREASWLGVVAGGAPTDLSRELAQLGSADTATVEAAIRPVVHDVVERSECTVRLLPDLTAVASGPVGEHVSTLLASCAETVRKDAASTWRFTSASISRYFAGGGDPDALLAALSGAAVTDIPQPLDYMIRDGARTTAPVQVAQQSDARQSGARHVDRVSSSVTRTGTDPRVIAAALTSGTPVSVDPERVARTVRAWSALPARDVDALARAVAFGGRVSVDVADPRSGIARDEIDDLVLGPGVVHAWSRRTAERRSITLARIRMVRAPAS